MTTLQLASCDNIVLSTGQFKKQDKIIKYTFYSEYRLNAQVYIILKFITKSNTERK